jgi:hypothetical protein
MFLLNRPFVSTRLLPRFLDFINFRYSRNTQKNTILLRTDLFPFAGEWCETLNLLGPLERDNSITVNPVLRKTNRLLPFDTV